MRLHSWQRHMGRRLLSLMLTVTLGLTAACGTAQEQETHGASGQRLIVGDPSFNEANEIPSANPQEAYSGWACLRYGLGETLFRFNEQMEAQPWLAESLTAQDDLTWELLLRGDVCFSDGEKLDAAAVKACLERLVKNLDRAAELLALEAIDLPDGPQGRRLILHTTKPLAILRQILADPMTCMVQAAALDRGELIGTGPFVLRELESNRRMLLDRNDRYWAGPVGLEGLEVRNFSDSQSLSLALQSGDIHAAQSVPYTAYPELKARGFQIDAVETSRVFFVEWNLHNALCQEPLVRQAVNLALNREDFCQKLLQGHASPCSGPFPKQLAAAPELPTVEQNIAQAGNLLEQAGWKDENGDGIRERGGQPLQLKLLTYPSRPELPVLATYMADCLRTIGVDVQVEVNQEYRQRLKDPGNWDLLASSMVTAPLGETSYFLRQVLSAEGLANRSGYANPKFDELVRALEGSQDETRRRQLSAEALEYIQAELPCIFVAHLRMGLVAHPDLEGLKAWPSDTYMVHAQMRWKK